MRSVRQHLVMPQPRFVQRDHDGFACGLDGVVGLQQRLFVGGVDYKWPRRSQITHELQQQVGRVLSGSDDQAIHARLFQKLERLNALLSEGLSGRLLLAVVVLVHGGDVLTLFHGAQVERIQAD